MVKSLVDALAGTASTCALIALGAGLVRYRVLHDLPSAMVITGLKLVIHPLAVWVLAFHVFTMPPAYAGVATLFAAMPVGINAYLLAAALQDRDRRGRRRRDALDPAGDRHDHRLADAPRTRLTMSAA